MSLHLLDLRPILELTRREKARLPVSVTQQPCGKLLVVSRYGDETWDFYPYIPQDNLRESGKQLDWRIALPDGRRLTDPEHAALLESTKDFIWSLFTQPIEGRKRPTMLTLVNRIDALKPLLCWMVSNGWSRFSDLQGRTLDYVPVARLGQRGQPVVDKNVVNRLTVVEDLYHQRDKLCDALRVHPWPQETVYSLAGLKQTAAHRKPKTEFIPDAIAARVGEAALDYVKNRADRILNAIAAVAMAGQKKSNAGLKKGSQVQAKTAAARAAGYKGFVDLKTEAIFLRTACYIVIGLFSGIRDSEIMSLKEGCIAPGKSRDGSIDVLWLHGMIYKTGQRPKRWIVPPAVGEAVEVLRRMTAPLRVSLRQEQVQLEARIPLSIAKERARLIKRLNTGQKQRDSLFLAYWAQGEGKISVLSGVSMNYCLKGFCAALGILGEDGRPYGLHSHQFRRTYARFIARSELGDLLVLREHFGHWSMDMTTFYADGGADEYEADTELLEMVTGEKIARQSDILSGYLDSDAPLANGGHWLKDWRASVRTAPNKEALIREYAGTLTLNGTGHSWCIGNANGTGCGGLCVFEPQMCVDCNYGIIGQEHRAVWKGIHDQQIEVLELNDIGPGGRARAKRILDYAKKVLRRLDGQVAE